MYHACACAPIFPRNDCCGWRTGLLRSCPCMSCWAISACAVCSGAWLQSSPLFRESVRCVRYLRAAGVRDPPTGLTGLLGSWADGAKRAKCCSFHTLLRLAGCGRVLSSCLPTPIWTNSALSENKKRPYNCIPAASRVHSLYLFIYSTWYTYIPYRISVR